MPFPAGTQLNCSTSSLPQKRNPGEAKLSWNPENEEKRMTLSSLPHLSSQGKSALQEKASK